MSSAGGPTKRRAGSRYSTTVKRRARNPQPQNIGITRFRDIPVLNAVQPSVRVYGQDECRLCDFIAFATAFSPVICAYLHKIQLPMEYTSTTARGITLFRKMLRCYDKNSYKESAAPFLRIEDIFNEFFDVIRIIMIRDLPDEVKSGKVIPVALKYRNVNKAQIVFRKGYILEVGLTDFIALSVDWTLGIPQELRLYTDDALTEAITGGVTSSFVPGKTSRNCFVDIWRPVEPRGNFDKICRFVINWNKSFSEEQLRELGLEIDYLQNSKI